MIIHHRFTHSTNIMLSVIIRALMVAGCLINSHNRSEGKICTASHFPSATTYWVLIFRNYQKQRFVSGMVYRPQNENFIEFFKAFELKKFLCDFKNLLHSHSFFPTRSKPTRVTKTTEFITDHIWSNNLQNCRTSGIIYAMVSEHE